MTREIVLDTETTGLSAQSGDRLVEIGCVELLNHVPTGQNYHAYINPERDMPAEAERIHGLGDEFLADKPLFSTVAGDFETFIADSTLIIHNAPFDMGFLNAELQRAGRAKLANEVIDTVQLARKRHPGARVSLDALCKHYGIDNSRRTLHGALLDSEILAEVYLELLGGRQVALMLGAEQAQADDDAGQPVQMPQKTRSQPLPTRLDPEVLGAHEELVASLGPDAIWAKYQS